MKINICKLFLCFTVLVFTHGSVAQKSLSEWQLGYFAPYISNIGGTFGYGHILLTTEGNTKSIHRLQVLTQLSYYTQLKVSNNVLIHPELVYKWNKSDKRFFLSSSVGMGYLLNLQRKEGKLNLATGKVEYQINPINGFLPTFNVGLGVDPKSHVGFYLKASVGGEFNAERTNAVFFGLSSGLIVKFGKKK